MAIFFIDADERIYARYGGRDGESAENRMSLEGLKSCMKSVLAEHQAAEKRYAAPDNKNPVNIRGGNGGGRCLHCHQVKEAMHAQMVTAGEWSRDLVWRFPLPDNLGIRLSVDKSNVIEKITPESPASKLDMKPGDVLRQLGKVPIHSFGDATFALDKAPATGSLDATWVRGDKTLSGKLELKDGWRKTDLTWRPSMRRLIPNVPLYGADLTSEERKQHGLTEKQVAFFQSKNLKAQAEQAGFQIGELIVGIEGQNLEMNVDDFIRHVQRDFLVGDTLNVVVLRKGQKQTLKLVLQNR